MFATKTFYEFFAGGGMARSGLGNGWSCVFANDFDSMKCATYRENWTSDDLFEGDIGALNPKHIKGFVDLAWGSFPCTDVSLAGGYKGLGQESDSQKTRSGAFWLFYAQMKVLKRESRLPRLIVLENVYGTLTSHEGADFTAIISSVQDLGYRLGAMIVDAKLFVPQSRPRLFIVAVRQDLSIPPDLISETPINAWIPAAMSKAHHALPEKIQKAWIWWNLPLPPLRAKNFVDIIEDPPSSVSWHTPGETRRILDLMSPVNAAKVTAARKAGKRMVGGIYRRTRPGQDGVKRQRAEVRFDNIAGCLRTPSGGSSRQTIIIVDGDMIRTRLLSPREAARLMGLPETYKLPRRYNDAYHVCGDGVVVPAVRHLAQELLEPILAANPPITKPKSRAS